MLRTIRIDIDEKHELYEYAELACTQSKNMQNTTNFYIRNLMTGLQKEEGKRFPLEKEVIENVRKYIEINNKKVSKKTKEKKKQLEIPTKENWKVNYEQLNAVFAIMNQRDYRDTHSHIAQNAIKMVVASWDSTKAALDDYKLHPEKYTGRPGIPKYKKGKTATAVFDSTNQHIEEDKETKKKYIKFSKLKDKEKNKKIEGKLVIGSYIERIEKIKEIKITPYSGIYKVSIIYEDKGLEEIKIEESNLKKNKDLRVIGIDLGVNNFATITNNVGKNPIIIKGNFIKTRNQYYNKYKGIETSRLQKGEDPNTKHKNSKRLNDLNLKRDRFFRDVFYKISHKICRFASENRIELIIVGKNTNWKNSVKLGKQTNQNFVSIPYSEFITTLRFIGIKYEIPVITTEESYTSKASFLDLDKIPVYKKGEDSEVNFSGTRIKRGLYKSKEGKIINADVNGSYNIIRKYLGDEVIDLKLVRYKKIRKIIFEELYPQHLQQYRLENSRKKKIA
jgi:putative transposase